jgi:tetratricopeptide (TPR) repeat protein
MKGVQMGEGRIRPGFIAFILLIHTAIVILPWTSYGAPPEIVGSLTAKLERWNAEDAWTEAKDLLARESKDPELLELASLVAFYRGEYSEAQKLIKSAIEQDGGDEKRKSFALFVEETIGVMTPFKRYESAHFIVSLDENQDGILADYITDALEKTYHLMGEHYGFRPREKIRVEVFPDAQAFYRASTLSARDIEIGAVGLAKFNKLMILSPAALVHGYRWLDAISHEYMHYLIVKLTANKAPIWFHEGLAKYEETRWRDGPSYLSSLYETLLVRALTHHRLIAFDKMEPSVVKLETPEDVQLAYAQAASAIEFIIAKAGHEGLKEIMKGMALSDQRGARGPIRDVLGMSFDDFEKSWKEFLSSKRLRETEEAKVRHYKIKEGKADEERAEMEEIKSLVARNRAHLGDRLKERGRTNAAVLEYRRALAETPDSIPIMNRLSGALIDLRRDMEALDLLKKSIGIDPDHPTAYTRLGEIQLKHKDFKKATEAFEASIQINPFNPEVHRGLAIASEALRDHATALREREITKRLMR